VGICILARGVGGEGGRAGGRSGGVGIDCWGGKGDVCLGWVDFGIRNIRITVLGLTRLYLRQLIIIIIIIIIIF
jgi:hypothetical protein